MPSNRYYLPVDFLPHARVCLEKEELHHLAGVARAKKGERVELINGRHQLATATVVQLRQSKVDLQIETIATKSPAVRPLTLIQAILPLPKLKLITQKTTELGVSQLVFFPAARSVKGTLTPSYAKRLLQTAIAAIKQCGRLDLPQITCVHSLAALPQQKCPLFFGDVRQGALPLLKTAGASPERAIVIGPESGLSPKELDLLQIAHSAIGVQIHPLYAARRNSGHCRDGLFISMRFLQKPLHGCL